MELFAKPGEFCPNEACPDYEPLFSILDGMHQDADKRFWIVRLEASEDN